MEITLLWSETEKDEDGFPARKETEYEAYAEEISVTRQEAYESMRAGVTVRMAWEIRREDWEQTRHVDAQGRPEYASQVRADGATYEIVRTYQKGKAKTEIYAR